MFSVLIYLHIFTLFLIQGTQKQNKNPLGYKKSKIICQHQYKYFQLLANNYIFLSIAPFSNIPLGIIPNYMVNSSTSNSGGSAAGTKSVNPQSH